MRLVFVIVPSVLERWNDAERNEVNSMKMLMIFLERNGTNDLFKRVVPFHSIPLGGVGGFCGVFQHKGGRQWRRVSIPSGC